MLTKEKHAIVQSLINSSSKDELIWINGYLSGILGNEILPTQKPADSSVVSAIKKLTIAYGTETGNSKKLATEFAAKAKKKQIQTKLISLEQYRLNDLEKEEVFVTVISTQGEGEPPAAAQKFYDHIHQNGFQLPKMQYAVLALGDTSYPLFCKAGEDVDQQLSVLGGKRLLPIQKCDVDYEQQADSWFDDLLKGLNAPASPAIVAAKPEPLAKTTGKTIYQGKILSHINLNDRGSNKETWHIEIAADGLQYESGDSIGIVPRNDASVVNEIIALTKQDKDGVVHYKNETYTVQNILEKKLNITHLNEKVIKRYEALVGVPIPFSKADLLDLLRYQPLKNPAQFLDLVLLLNPQSPRLYTVSSSPAALTDEVHITVARDVFWIDQQKKFGLCSDFLSSLKENEVIEFFVQKNKRFKLPALDKDIIMVGPGTGIAAFRGFLQEREAVGAAGRNWLFFGEQHFASDFLYQTEIQNWEATGTLTKANLAFSRDQQKKIYVQDRMLEQGAELFQWLQAGAYFYVCGKKDPMSVDVENTLLQIIEKYGQKTAEEASAYINELKESHRYHKDVY